MSVDTVIDQFLADIRKNYNLEIFDVIAPSPDETTGEVPAYYDPKTDTELVCSNFDTARKKVNTGFLYLFNDLEHPNGEHQNFLMLNSISEIFRQTPSYSFTTKEFTDKLEYAYTCGQLYTSYSKGCTGEFIKNSYQYIPINITRICNKYQELYDAFIPDPPSSDPDAEIIPKITQFWNKYSGAFSKEIAENNPPIETLSSNFDWFYNKITEYKDLGTNAAKIQAVGYVFYDAKNRVQLINQNMDIIFSLCRYKFKLYDTLVDDLYELWIKTINHVESEYKDLNSYEKESMKQKIYSGQILEVINFYTNAKNIYDDFLTFFTQYSIN